MRRFGRGNTTTNQVCGSRTSKLNSLQNGWSQIYGASGSTVSEVANSDRRTMPPCCEKNQKTRILNHVFLLCALLLTGCAQTTYWLKTGGSQDEFNRTQAACHNDSYMLPRTQAIQSQPNYRITANVNPFGGVTATAVPFKNPYQSIGDGLDSFAAAADNIARRERFVQNCMVVNGWRQIATSDTALTIETYARLGTAPSVEYSGKSTGYLDGSGTIKLANTSGGQCVGTFRYDTQPSTGGTGIVRCDDGDSAQIRFTKINSSSGYGSGVSEQGKPLRFVYGIPAELREQYLRTK